MALINKIDNTSSLTYGGSTITSNTVSTLLLLPPTLLKTVDKLTASINDTLTYTITIANPTLSDMTNLPFTDTIANGASYVAGSFKVNGTAATPTITGSKLTYTVPTVSALGSATIIFQVTVGGGTN